MDNIKAFQGMLTIIDPRTEKDQPTGKTFVKSRSSREAKLKRDRHTSSSSDAFEKIGSKVRKESGAQTDRM